MGKTVSRPTPSPGHREPIVDESIRRPDPHVQDLARALLRMDPADRQPLIRRLIALIMHVEDESTDRT